MSSFLWYTYWCPYLSLFYITNNALFKTAFSSRVEGKNEEMSTAELSGGARIHYIFQSIFVKSLEVCILDFGVGFLLE